jgi:hypothetical protein
LTWRTRPATIALGRYLKGASLRSLRLDARAAIEATPVETGLGIPIRHVPFTPEQALDAYDDFRHGADAPVTVSGAWAMGVRPRPRAAVPRVEADSRDALAPEDLDPERLLRRRPDLRNNPSRGTGSA